MGPVFGGTDMSVMTISSRSRGRLLPGLAELDRLDDVVVARAAADVAVERFADLRLARLRVVLQQVDGRHHHAGGAEAALQAVALAERGLHRVQLAVGGEALDGRDLGALHLQREHRARLHRAAVHVHRARAALRGVAADVRAGEPELLADELHEQRARIHAAGHGLAVDRQRNGNVHGVSFGPYEWNRHRAERAARDFIVGPRGDAANGLTLRAKRDAAARGGRHRAVTNAYRFWSGSMPWIERSLSGSGWSMRTTFSVSLRSSQVREPGTVACFSDSARRSRWSSVRGV